VAPPYPMLTNIWSLFTPCADATTSEGAVRNDRGHRGNVGIIRSPVRASILPNRLRHWLCTAAMVLMPVLAPFKVFV
jgi:hypothetical protein